MSRCPQLAMWLNLLTMTGEELGDHLVRLRAARRG